MNINKNQDNNKKAMLRVLQNKTYVNFLSNFFLS